MKRRIVALFSLLLIMCSIFTIPVCADAPELDVPEDPIEPEAPYVDLALLTASIDINSSGKASCYGYAITATSTYTVYLSISLQRYKNGTWSTIKNWSTSGTWYTSLGKSYYVTAGYSYRTAVSVTVRTSGGSYVESAVIYSQSQYY